MLEVMTCGVGFSGHVIVMLSNHDKSEQERQKSLELNLLDEVEELRRDPVHGVPQPISQTARPRRTLRSFFTGSPRKEPSRRSTGARSSSLNRLKRLKS